MIVATQSTCNFACAYAGCGRRYAHPDAARKHARRHHSQWVAERDAEKLPCHCVVDGDEWSLPLSRQASFASGSYCSINMLRAAAVSGVSLMDELDGRVGPAYVFPERAAFGPAVAEGDLQEARAEPLDAARAGAPPVVRRGSALSQTPHAFQLLVAAAIAASDNDSSSADHSDDAIMITPEPMAC